MLLFAAAAAFPEAPDALPQAGISSTQIVALIEQHNTTQSQQIKHYQALRHYRVEYSGYATRIAAGMDVEVTFDVASGKTFRIVSQSGSKLLCDKVLKRAVDSEKEASEEKGSTALSIKNYQFQLVGTELVAGRLTYILKVDPIADSKFLYRGKVWVDAADYAVVKIEAEPAKNPSFWISKTVIAHNNVKIDGAWLPQKNRSESRIRVGGTAVLTIDYGTYHIAVEPPLATAAARVHIPTTAKAGASGQ
ncbi:MAG TPA: outer membrane lipoprotein-sorting protein [Terracidiphilus sp.]|nr:outer membrane lipoprotein-sorting protein [Terracidiphilus sp.]